MDTNQNAQPRDTPKLPDAQSRARAGNSAMMAASIDPAAPLAVPGVFMNQYSGPDQSPLLSVSPAVGSGPVTPTRN